ncbi:endonuclease domain-containing protein [Leifsonia poae]|uniref:endonuclease domain-containing protein n=1 Tax=Leifsonia poae TaxID=110933 RepID=UPI003D67C880
MIDTALSAGAVRYSDVGDIFATEPKWAQAIAAAAKPGSDSGVESLTRQRLSAAGHLVEQQVSVPGVGRVDLRIDGRLYLEIDGFAYHSSPEAFDRDRARDTAIAVRGSRRLRFSANQVLHDWRWVSDSIETMLLIPDVSTDSPRNAPEFRSVRA